VAKARDIPELHGAMAFRDVAGAAVAVRTREVFEHADGVLDTDEIERVHDMRVATRRLRAVLEVFAPAFEPTAHAAVLREVKALADALGARRDPDVQLAALAALGAALPAADQPGLELFAARLRADQEQGNATLAAALRRIADDDLQARLLALAGDADREPAG
jgi:CHAD domain-containing protein